ncbi:unnamed protein product [Enterobius vermicularis]|uniref:Transcription elongation factor SPT4 n=1 Tax=Enterobius vermicularis TaxID=51028 RepID=A0A0N4V8I0_ENTVE|nr:unnamed protein product [Enterobius vermicularis]
MTEDRNPATDLTEKTHLQSLNDQNNENASESSPPLQLEKQRELQDEEQAAHLEKQDEQPEMEKEGSLEEQIENLLSKSREDGKEISEADELRTVAEFCLNRLRDIGDSEEEGETKQHLLSKLVDCRFRLERLKEFDVTGEMLHIRTHKNHELVVQSARGRNPYCEVCMSTVWRLIQSDHSFPSKLSLIKIKDHYFSLITKICPERGLDAQDYACAECRKPLQFGSSADVEPRLCDYNGLYYCSHCHWNDEWMIPARVLSNWDCNKYKVCRASKQLLSCIDRKPLYNFSQQNPRLLKFVAQLMKIHKLRTNIMFMKCYFVCCKEARKLRILQYLNRRQHFVENAEMYSLADLRDLVEGRLIPEIEQIVSIFAEHITRDCLICQGNGFVCELCSDDKADYFQVIYPFSEGVAICQVCCAVFHSQCFNVNSKRCPRIIMRGHLKRKQRFAKGFNRLPNTAVRYGIKRGDVSGAKTRETSEFRAWKWLVWETRQRLKRIGFLKLRSLEVMKDLFKCGNFEFRHKVLHRVSSGAVYRRSALFVLERSVLIEYFFLQMSVDSVPRDLRNLRACLLCSMVKSLDQFVLDGCDNCERYLTMKGDEEKVSECTSSNFDGIIAAASPEDSWVCKWQKINRKVKGVYAVSVSGSLPSHIIQELKAQNVRYVPNMRDTTEKV